MHLTLLPNPFPVPRHELRQPLLCDKAISLPGDCAEFSFSAPLPDRRAGVPGQPLHVGGSERVGFLCPDQQEVRFPDPRIGFLPVRLSGGGGEDGR